MTRRKMEYILSSNPNPLRLNPNPDLSSNRKTVFSPYTVGRTATRTSISLFDAFIVNRPSCGNLRSAILRLDSIFILVTNPLKEDIGGVIMV